MYCNCKHIERLTEQVKRHEQTIVQLVEIIGQTNHRLSKLMNDNKRPPRVVTVH